MRIIADLSLEDTAIVLGKTVGAVKSLQHRGLAAVTKILSTQTAVS
jgi:RNA polymerase sigma-70 factor (ECF subfamily)